MNESHTAQSVIHYIYSDSRINGDPPYFFFHRWTSLFSFFSLLVKDIYYCDRVTSHHQAQILADRRFQAPITAKQTSCRENFFIDGPHSECGFYHVKGRSISGYISCVIYWDFSKSSIETGYETRYGFYKMLDSFGRRFFTNNKKSIGI